MYRVNPLSFTNGSAFLAGHDLIQTCYSWPDEANFKQAFANATKSIAEHFKVLEVKAHRDGEGELVIAQNQSLTQALQSDLETRLNIVILTHEDKQKWDEQKEELSKDVSHAEFAAESYQE